MGDKSSAVGSRALAAVLNVSPKVVYTWTSLGMPLAGDNPKRWNVAACKRWMRGTGKGSSIVGRGGKRAGSGSGRRYRPAASSGTLNSVGHRLAIARAKDAEASAAKKTMAMDQLQGKLIPVDEARLAWGRALQILVDQLEAVSGRVADRCMASLGLSDPDQRTAIVGICDEEINRARSAVADDPLGDGGNRKGTSG